MRDAAKVLLILAALLVSLTLIREAEATAQPETVKPVTIRPHSPLYEQERVVPCLDRPNTLTLHEYYLEGQDGERIPPGFEALRKRC
jgi:hypothetical protein